MTVIDVLYVSYWQGKKRKIKITRKPSARDTVAYRNGYPVSVCVWLCIHGDVVMLPY